MKPIIVTYSNESLILTPEGWAALKSEFAFGFFMRLGEVVATGINESDIKLIARPKK